MKFQSFHPEVGLALLRPRPLLLQAGGGHLQPLRKKHIQDGLPVSIQALQAERTIGNTPERISPSFVFNFLLE